MSVATSISPLSRTECLNLLQFHAFVGRVGFNLEGKPMVLPVNYIADENSIVFVTPKGTKFEHLANGAPAVFEIDDSRPLFHAGWSVVAQGTAHEITDPHELDQLRRGPLHSWVVSNNEHWVRIKIDEITGRRIPES